MVIPLCTDPSGDPGHDQTNIIVGITVPIIGFLILIIIIAATLVLYCKYRNCNIIMVSTNIYNRQTGIFRAVKSI